MSLYNLSTGNDYKDDRYYLSVLCGSVAMYGIAIELTEDEIVRVNEEGLSGLVEAVRMRPQAYNHRNISDFNHSAN